MVLKVEGYFAEMSQKVLIFLVVKKKMIHVCMEIYSETLKMSS